MDRLLIACMCLVDWPAVDDDLGSAIASLHVSRGCACHDAVKKDKVAMRNISINMYISYIVLDCSMQIAAFRHGCPFILERQHQHDVNAK